MFVQSTVIRYGDHVDTDVIIPARYLNTTDPAELAAHCMEDLDSDFKREPHHRRGAQLRLRLLPRARAHRHQGQRHSARHRGQLRPHLLPQLD